MCVTVTTASSCMYDVTVKLYFRHLHKLLQSAFPLLPEPNLLKYDEDYSVQLHP